MTLNTKLGVFLASIGFISAKPQGFQGQKLFPKVTTDSSKYNHHSISIKLVDIGDSYIHHKDHFIDFTKIYPEILPEQVYETYFSKDGGWESEETMEKSEGLGDEDNLELSWVKRKFYEVYTSIFGTNQYQMEDVDENLMNLEENSGRDYDPMSKKHRKRDDINVALCRARYSKPKVAGDWNMLWIETHEANEFEELSYTCAGFVQGMITAKETYEMYLNLYADWFQDYARSPEPAPIMEFLVNNYYYMKDEVNRNYFDDYWFRVGLILSHMEGLYKGYNYVAKHQPELELPYLSIDKFLLLNADGDIETLAEFYPKQPDDYGGNWMDFKDYREQRCSALVRVVRDRKGRVQDILMGHSTWDHYEMLAPRTLKTFDFKSSKHSFIMSSSAGFISSVDDFYMTGEGLIVMETTNDLYNKTLHELVSERSLLTWVRSRLANYQKDPFAWVDVFSKHNSGTYNNQWMILDTNRFKRSNSKNYYKHSEDGVFIVLEQYPGYIKYEDFSSQLFEDNYFASYNIPVFKETWDLGNYSKQTPAYQYHHEDCPRARIFKRDVESVVDLESFQKLIRYNDYKNDPLSEGNACFAISSRCDLNDVADKAFKLSGGLDAKITSLNMIDDNDGIFSFVAQLGPSSDDQKSFNWTEFDEMIARNKKRESREYRGFVAEHYGQSNVYDYPWIGFSFDYNQTFNFEIPENPDIFDDEDYDEEEFDKHYDIHTGSRLSLRPETIVVIAE